MARKNLDLSSPIITEFTKAMAEYVRTTIPSQADTVRGVIQSVEDGVATVILDGSTVTTLAEMQVDARANDNVIVEIKDHQAAVIRNIDYTSGGGSELPDGDNMEYGTSS